MTDLDRRDIVSVVEEMHALIGNSLATDVPPFVVIRTDLIVPLQRLPEQALIEDSEMLALMRGAYFELINNVGAIQSVLLGPTGEALDQLLTLAGLTGQQLALKAAGFRRELAGTLNQSVQPRRRRWFRRAARWANIVLGSLSSVPVVGPIAEPLKEFKDSVETQVEQESQPEG